MQVVMQDCGQPPRPQQREIVLVEVMSDEDPAWTCRPIEGRQDAGVGAADRVGCGEVWMAGQRSRNRSHGGIVQPVASLRFFKTGRFAFGPALGLTIGGSVGVLIAIFIVRQLPLLALRWLVIVVVTYAAVSMLRSAYRERAGALVTPAI